MPFDALNVPGGHARHDKDSKPSVVAEPNEFVKVKPSTHRQSVRDAAPGSESELGGQAMHPELPSTLAEYVPDGQALQVLIDVAPMAVENRPAPHLRHPMLLFVGANVPAGQGMHPAVPFDALNVPGRQGTHLFSPSPFGVNVKSAAVFDVCDPTMLSCSCDMLASKPCLHGHLDRFPRVEFSSIASVELPDTSDMASTTA